MPARIATQHKSPFALDSRRFQEMSSPHAGLLSTSRAFRLLKISDLIAANLKLKQRKRGCSEAEYVEALVLLQTAGGDCPEDIQLLMPSQHFAVNAAWFKLALLAYNIARAIKGLCFSAEERTARHKKYRLLLLHLAGRMSRFRCKLSLRFCASKQAIARVQKVWEVFALPTQATAFWWRCPRVIHNLELATPLRTMLGLCLFETRKSAPGLASSETAHPYLLCEPSSSSATLTR